MIESPGVTTVAKENWIKKFISKKDLKMPKKGHQNQRMLLL